MVSVGLIKHLVDVFIKIMRYRGGILLYILANMYLLSTIPFSWLYYDIRYYLEWVDLAWSRGLTVILTRIPGFPPVVVLPRGILYIYVYATKASYPPLPIWLFIATHSLASSISPSLQVIRLIDKFPLIISFNLIYLLLRKYYGWKAGFLWIINHFSYATIYSYHTDLIVGLFLILFYINFIHGNYGRSSLFLAAASLFKPIVLISAIIPLIVMLRGKKYREILWFIIPGLILGVVVLFPYLYVDPNAFLYKAIFFHGQRYPQEYSLWAIPIYLAKYDLTIIPDWIKWAWMPVYVIVLSSIIYKFLKLREYDEDIMLKYILLILLATLLVNKVGNTNYFLWVLPFLAIFTVKERLYRDRNYMVLYIFVSILMVVVAPVMTFYTAFVVQGDVFVIEDLTYYSATSLARRTFDPYTLQYILADYLRMNAYWLFSIIYMGISISYSIYSLVYGLYLIYLIKKVYDSLRRGFSGARVS